MELIVIIFINNNNFITNREATGTETSDSSEQEEITRALNAKAG